MSVIKKPLARAAYAKLPKYGRTNTTTRWFTTASGRMALDLDAMCVERFPHRRTSGRLLSWHGWMEAAILLRPMPLAEAELTGRAMGMGLNVLITEAGRRLGVSEPTASLMTASFPAALCVMPAESSEHFLGRVSAEPIGSETSELLTLICS